MRGSLDAPPIVVVGSRLNGAMVAGGASMFVLYDVLAARGAAALSQLAFGLVFFGLCAAVGLAMVIWPSRLELGPAGLTQRVMWRIQRYAWSDICDFRPASLGVGAKTVSFSFTAARPAGPRQVNTAVAGAQASLQAGWEVDPATLADLLNQARERWLKPAIVAGVPRD
jgi:hypothetical protein